jgi:hypothetical protein
VRVAHIDGESLEDKVKGSGERYLENIGDEDLFLVSGYNRENREKELNWGTWSPQWTVYV